MTLYQSNQTSVIENDDDGGSGTCSKITRTLSTNTWYYVKIRGYNSSTTGSYTIDVSGGGSTTLNPQRNLTATAGDTEATLNWSAPSSGMPSSYKVYYSLSENGTYTTLNNQPTGTSNTITGMTNGTTYWFYVTAVYSSGESDASNKISVRPTGGTTTVTTLTVNASAVSASLTAGDEDWFKFQTSTSGTYAIETHGSTDTYMTLYQSNQTTVIENDDDSGSGTCSKITRTLSASTWYYVKVRGYSSLTTGSYTIDVIGGGSTTLNPPRNLTATAGDTEATLNWSAPSSGTPSSYKVYYSLSENGTYTALNNQPTGTSNTITGMTNGTTYWFYVTAVYSSGESDASNKISVRPTGGTTTVTTLTVNASAVSASLTAGDNDWFKFQTSTSGAYVIETHGSTDTYMTLYQSNQTTVIENDDDSGSGTCSKITRTLSASTWYYVKVRGYSSSTTGSYTIDVTEEVQLLSTRHET